MAQLYQSIVILRPPWPMKTSKKLWTRSSPLLKNQVGPSTSRELGQEKACL